MIRACFRANGHDPRPVVWPLNHPYWITGYALRNEHASVVAYADDEAEILKNWPDATHIHVEEVDWYEFTDRFPCPSWFDAGRGNV